MTFLRRRRFLVDRTLQIKLIFVSLSYVAFYVVMMAIATFIPLFFEMRTVSLNSFRAYLLANSFIYLHRHIWPITLLVLLAVSFHSLLISHKLAGPLYRCRHIFLELAAGKLPQQQRIRKGDYLQYEMKLINEMIERLRTKTGNIQEAQKAIASSVSGILKRSDILSDSELSLLAKDLETQGKKLAEHALLFEKEC